ncbi:MAG TPA: 3-deoxy-D-manno-octulosonic acid transferase [Pyrinomonadaceae bacterium]|nr:3-deoxy-D-manno-octulosonic acid transferase [Pyrinomonadaceae bacterium]
MYFLYSLLLTFAILALLPLFLFDALRHGKYVAGLRERLGDVPETDARGRKIIWLHCVSVGETQAARPLARVLVERFPTHALVVSTTTLTGQRLAREVFRDDAAAVFYFPFDWALSVRRTLGRVKPSLVLIMETELWPRFLRECQRSGVPVALVNGRISEKSFKNYRRLGRFIKSVTATLTLAVMQSETDAERIRALGLAPERVYVSGNIKFDADTATGEQAITSELRERFSFDDERPLIVAASTHEPEEAITLDAFKQTRAALDRNKRPRLLIAPRHPERFNEVAALLDASGLAWARRSRSPKADDATCDVVLLDSIGELRGVYPLAALVFVGGSIARTGGHNVLEPAAAARCIITGAHTFNFSSITRDFLERGALIQLPALTEQDAPAALAQIFRELLNTDERRRRTGERARAALEQNRGATDKTIEYLASLIEQRSEVRGQRSDKDQGKLN